MTCGKGYQMHKKDRVKETMTIRWWKSRNYKLSSMNVSSLMTKLWHGPAYRPHKDRTASALRFQTATTIPYMQSASLQDDIIQGH